MIVDKFEILDYISQKGFNVKEKGNEIVFENCPYCEKESSGSKFQHFYFNSDNGAFFCQKCQERGNFNKFRYDQGDYNLIKSKNIKYIKPEKIELSINDKFFEWYEKERGIKKEIVNKYEVQYKKQNDKLIFIYQYFDEKGNLINRKYRSSDKTMMWTEKGAERIYYGLQFIDFNTDNKTLHICEGEDDCHALVQLGIKNVVSVPFGAGNYTPSMHFVNERFDTLILIFDNDEKGQLGARKFAEKAGLAKCKNVILGYKDARECLINNYDSRGMKEDIEEAQGFKHENIIKSSDIKTDLIESLFSNKQIDGYYAGWKDFNKITGGIRTGELSILIGHTGKGKSTFAYNLASKVIDSGMKAMIFPFENKIRSVLKKMIEIRSEKCVYKYNESEKKLSLHQSKEWIEAEIDKLNNLELYYLNKSIGGSKGYYTIEKVKEIIEYANKFYDVNFFVIDHLHYFLKLSDARNPTQLLDESMRSIKLWTEEFNCHIVLIVHPHMTQDTRTGEVARLGLNSTKGASSISQEADNFWIIERSVDGDNKSIVRVEKNREIGRTGSASFKILENNNTFVEEDF